MATRVLPIYQTLPDTQHAIDALHVAITDLHRCIDDSRQRLAESRDLLEWATDQQRATVALLS